MMADKSYAFFGSRGTQIDETMSARKHALTVAFFPGVEPTGGGGSRTLTKESTADAAGDAFPEWRERGRYRCRVTERPPMLYIFPHAGGSAEYYVPFAKAFSSDIK